MTRSRGRARELLLGSPRRLGLWILPLFLVTALLGATLAGALAVLYYGQRVAQLEAATAGGRAEVEAAVERVTATADEAEAAIAEEVLRLREALAGSPPVERLSDAGVYAVAASHAGGEVRVGSAFVVLTGRDETALVTTYRLIEAYETVLRRAGMIAYRFHIAPENQAWRRLLDRLGITPYAENGDGAFYRRAL